MLNCFMSQSNGLVERFNQSLQEKKEKWDDYFKHESTKFTPFEIMFGRKAILTLDLDAGVHQGSCNEAEVTRHNISGN